MNTAKRAKSGMRILTGVCLFALLFSLISLIVTKFVYDSQFPRL